MLTGPPPKFHGTRDILHTNTATRLRKLRQVAFSLPTHLEDFPVGRVWRSPTNAKDLSV